MKTKALWILLAASIAFNLFFVAGYMQSQKTLNRLKTAEGKARIVAERIGLDAGQTAEFIAINDQRLESVKRLERENQAAYEAYWQEALRSESDEAKMVEISQSHEAVLKARSAAKRKSLLDALKIMTPEQREKYASMIRNRTLLAE